MKIHMNASFEINGKNFITPTLSVDLMEITQNDTTLDNFKEHFFKYYKAAVEREHSVPK